MHQQISTLQQRISTLEQLEIELRGSNTEKSNAVEQLQHALNEQGSQWQTYVAQLQEQHQNERKQKEENKKIGGFFERGSENSFRSRSRANIITSRQGDHGTGN